jgi:CBS domain-containing protein
MRIGDVMTINPVCCVPTDSARTAARLMKEHDTGIIPIVENRDDPQLVGVVTDRDPCMAVLAEGTAAEQVQVKDCMTTNVLSCRPDEDVKKAEALMREHLVRRIPVIDHHNRIRGIISIANLLRRTEQPQDTQKTLKRISTPPQKASRPRAVGQ